jgi:hypothetical protein
MYGKIRINVKEIDDEASAVEIHTELDNGSPEEVMNIVHGLSDAFNLLKNPEFAGVLALSILTNKQACQLAEEISPERLVVLGNALHTSVNEVVEEIIVRNSKRESDNLIKRMVDCLFKN